MWYNGKNIYYDETSATYVIKHENDGLIVKKEQVVAIKSLKRGKVDAYIIKLDAPITHYTNENSENFDIEKLEDTYKMR